MEDLYTIPGVADLSDTRTEKVREKLVLVFYHMKPTDHLEEIKAEDISHRSPCDPENAR